MIAIVFFACDKGTDSNEPRIKTFQETWFPVEVGYRWTDSLYHMAIGTKTVVNDTSINGHSAFAVRYDYTDDYAETHIVFWFVNSDSAWLMVPEDSTRPQSQWRVASFPFIAGIWSETPWAVSAWTDEEGDTIGEVQHFGVPYGQEEIEVPAGLFEDSWRVDLKMILIDSLGIIDTSDFFTSDYFGKNVGWIKIQEQTILMSFETDVDVDTLWPLPDVRSSGERRRYNRLGYVVK
ncbi:MAG: hypothetical protein ACP5G4_02660 [bacterium]